MKPFFYSQLQRAVSAAPDKVFGKAENVKNWLLANQSKLNIKKDEIVWSGIADWLDTQDKITKADVLAYLDGNGVQVQEVILGDIKYANKEEAFKAAERGENVWLDARATNGGDLTGPFDAEDIADMPDGMDWVIEGGAKELNDTKFEKHTLPGGVNYRELLLTLPFKNKAPSFEEWNESREFLGDKQGTRQQYDGDVGYYNARGTYATEDIFKSTHYSQPNILAHIRFNERTDAEGKRVLFIEEIQSDWGQSGKKRGFNAGGYTISETNEKLPHGGNWWVIKDAAGAVVSKQAFESAAKAKLQEMQADVSGSVPSAPFVTDTKSWTALALKRMISYAAENGIDRLAWTTGEQQTDRYDLSKQISEINYGVLETGEYNLEIKGIDGRRLDNVELRRVPESDLDKVVGKDVAAKIIAGDGVAEKDNRKILSGINLKVGGEGMKGYYDQIVPQVANDILKKFGGKVESVRVNTGQPTKSDRVFRVVIEGDFYRIREGMAGEFVGEKYEKRTDAEGAMSLLYEGDQQGFTITSEMRAKVMGEGLPLFSLSQIDEQKSLSVDLIKDEVDRLISKWPSAPEVTIVQSASEIPFGVPSHADGVLHEGKAYLIADNIGTVAQIQKVLAHECVLHHSLLDMLGEYGFAKLHNGVQSLKASGDKTVIGLSQAVAQQYGPLTPEDETKEIVAKAGERCIDAEGNIKIQYAFMKEAYAGVANFMRDKGFQIPFTNIELQGIISNAGKWIARDRGVEDTVSTGHFIGKVLSISNGRVSQKVGREPGQVVSHDVAKLNTKPVVGQLAEIRYQDGKGHVIERSKAPSMQR